MAVYVVRLLVALMFICTFVSGKTSVAAAPQSAPHGVTLVAQEDQDGMLPGVVVPPAVPPTTGQDGMLPSVVTPPTAPPAQGQDGMLPGVVPPPAAPPAQGQDGMLPDETSVDDDGDGVQDADDSAPHNPNEGSRPAPGPTDPIADDDNDGLPNVMDPDDNNNGKPDADEGVGTVDNVPPAPVKEKPGPGTVSPVTSSSNPQQGSSERPVVLNLPSTGSGVAHAGPAPITLLAGSISLLAAAGISLHKRRA